MFIWLGWEQLPGRQCDLISHTRPGLNQAHSAPLSSTLDQTLKDLKHQPLPHLLPVLHQKAVGGAVRAYVQALGQMPWQLLPPAPHCSLQTALLCLLDLSGML